MIHIIQEYRYSIPRKKKENPKQKSKGRKQTGNRQEANNVFIRFISGYIDRLKECYKKTYVGEARCLEEIYIYRYRINKLIFHFLKIKKNQKPKIVELCNVVFLILLKINQSFIPAQQTSYADESPKAKIKNEIYFKSH